jgi:hypothetical protein
MFQAVAVSAEDIAESARKEVSLRQLRPTSALLLRLLLHF